MAEEKSDTSKGPTILKVVDVGGTIDDKATKEISNALVLAICISEYTNSGYNLPGRKIDLNTIIQLAADFEYGIVHNPKDTVNKSTCDRLFKMTSKQLRTGKYDALFAIFSCHGRTNQSNGSTVDQVILSDNKAINIRNIITYFNGQALPQFVHKPKFFLFDCPNSDIKYKQDELIPIKEPNDHSKLNSSISSSKTPLGQNQIVHNYHPDCNIIMIQPMTTSASNTIIDISKAGHLVQAFDNVYRSDTFMTPSYYLQNLCDDIKSTVYQTSQQSQCVQSTSTLFPYYDFGIKPKLTSHHTMEEKQDNISVNNGNYQINIKNESGVLQMVALYQVDPSGAFLPLVWRKVPIANNGVGSFKWNLKWGLSFGNSLDSPLKAGVQFIRTGEVIDVDLSVRENSARVSYDDTTDNFKISGPIQQGWLPQGVLGVNTDRSFNNVIARERMLSICVTVHGIPVAAITGRPNMSYTFTTQPKYYLALTHDKPGTAINNSIINAREIVFKNYNFVVNCSINASNTILVR